MATIPVEKKTSTPVWLWLLPLLLLALLAWFLLNRDDDETAETDTTTVITDDDAMATGATDDFGMGPDDATALDTTLAGAAGTANAAGAAAGAATGAAVGAATGAAVGAATGAAGTATGAITSSDGLYATDLTSLVGRRVEIDEATVLSVVGDSTFYVGQGDKKFLVALTGLGEGASGPGDNGDDGRLDINTGDRIRLRGAVTRFDGSNAAFRVLSDADRTAETTRGAYVNVTRRADVTKL